MYAGSNKRSTHRQRRSQFTLIEILIVVGVIGLLAGLLGPSLANAMDKARYARWRVCNAQWNSDPSCVINFDFESPGHQVELPNGTKVEALPNTAEACDTERFDAQDYCGILVNGPTWTTGRWGRHKKALQFDGVNDFVIVPTADAVDFQPVDDDFTICVWACFDRFAFGDTLLSKSQWGRSSQYTMYWYAGHMETDVGLACVAYDSPVPKVGEWVCYIMVNQVGQGYQLYANGEPMSFAGTGAGVSPETVPLGYLILGAAGIWQNRVGFHFRGRIDECVVFKRALSTSEVRGFYQMGNLDGPVVVAIGYRVFPGPGG